MKKGLSNLLTIVLSVFLLGSCEKEMDKYYERPDWLAGSVYDVLQKKGNYTLFLQGVERTGYKEMLAGHGLCTVFAPDDDAFRAYLKERNYSGLEAIPEDSLSMLISYHILKYQYNQEMLLDFRPAGLQNIETCDGRYYKHQTYTKGPVAPVPDKYGRIYNVYQQNKQLPVFSSRLFEGKKIGGEYNYRYFFPASEWSPEGNSLHVANAAVKEYDIPADNGYIFLINEVIRPLRTIYDVLHSHEDYSLFSSLYDKFGSFSYSSSLSASYAPAGDSLYVYHHRPLPSIFGEETGSILDFASGQPVPVPSLAGNAYNIYAPGNEALNDFLRDYLPGYASYDDVPYLPLYYLLSEHAPATRSIVFPEEIRQRGVNSDFGLIYDFDVDQVNFREMCSNGPFYGLREAIVPIVYRSVTGDVLGSPDYKIFTHMLYKTGEMMQLVNAEGLTNRFTLFAVPDAVFNEWGYFYKVDAGGAFKEATIQINGKNISTAEMMAVTDMHIVAAEIEDFSKMAIYETKGGGYMKVWKDGIFGEEKSGTPYSLKKVKPVNKVTNGVTYDVAGIVTPVQKEGGMVLNTLLQYDDYREFYALLKKAGLVNEKQEITLLDRTKFMLFVPTNQALQNAAASIPDDPAELAEWLKYYFVSLNYNSALAYVYPGIENKYRYGSFYTLTRDALLSTVEKPVFRPLRIGDTDDASVFCLRIGNGGGSWVYTVKNEFPMFAGDGIVYRIEGVIQPE